MVFGPASRLGVSFFEETDPYEVWPGIPDQDKEAIIRAAYRQIYGNAYVMDSERAIVAESQFKLGMFSVREFVRQLGKSDYYLSHFFDCPRYRAFELCFRHFLGRAPNNYDEMKVCSAVLDSGGSYQDLIDYFVDSDEYQEVFGEDTVPYVRGYKTEACQNMIGFTHTFELVRGASSSDLKGSLAGKRPVLNDWVINGTATPVTTTTTFQTPALAARTRHGIDASSGGKTYRIEVTGYRANTVNRVSKFRRSNKVYLVPFDKLSEEYQRIHAQGGTIVSITAV
ncbi:phycobilisome linker polypeptide [Synechococcus sp. PCC 7336]|uniref:phycobilisome linker polypeptide n=1 Tax=Synechococcus sp. PCC 7336 TaxID=195250 RepID=UPI000364D00D|nr:phycobilisome linker polypeptide [Synechococcus sp. PCC 7336]